MEHLLINIRRNITTHFSKFISNRSQRQSCRNFYKPLMWNTLICNSAVFLNMCQYSIKLFAALSGILFPGKEEAAYSNFRLWEATGSVLAYAYSPYVCTNIKLYILLGVLCVGFIGYIIIIRTDKATKKTTRNVNREFKLVTTGESPE